ncbi:MAG: hypothetical protein ACI9YL_001545 [Luteibaculaceae bacterium]|jgi:hypothetical protein
MVKKKKSFVIRMDPDMYDLLHQWADSEFRSVNGQLEFIIHDALRKAGKIPKAGNGKKES